MILRIDAVKAYEAVLEYDELIDPGEKDELTE